MGAYHARRLTKVGAELIAAEEKGAALLEEAKQALAAGAADAADRLKEWAKHRTVIQRLAREVGQWMTPRCETSMTTKVADLIGSSDKMWPRSVVVQRMVEAHPEENPDDVRDNVDDALRRLVKDRAIERVSHGLYQSARD
jgi:hypothetical protein